MCHIEVSDNIKYCLYPVLRMIHQSFMDVLMLDTNWYLYFHAFYLITRYLILTIWNWFKNLLYSKIVGCYLLPVTCRGQPNRGYKKPNPNPNISSMIFGSYNRSRIVQKGIRFLINRIPNIGFLCSVYKKPNSWFKPNYSFGPNIRIFVPNIDRIIRFNRIMSKFTGNRVISRCLAPFF